jgi:cell division protein ZipA
VPDFRRGRVEPTLNVDSVTEELRVQDPEDETASMATSSAPTLSSSDTPPPQRRPSVRKILSLRLSLAPQRVEGAKLQEVLHEELLALGKYDVFHRLHSDGQSVFSIASMVEPGTFDAEKMGETQYPGVTLFAQLPGPVPGMHALNELVACARRLHQTLGGVLQDDRGVPLTVHRIERMRQEVRDFERPQGARGSQE